MVGAGYPEVRFTEISEYECFAPTDLEVRWRWQNTRYVALKLFINGLVKNTAASTELEMLRCIATMDPKSEGCDT